MYSIYFFSNQIHSDSVRSCDVIPSKTVRLWKFSLVIELAYTQNNMIKLQKSGFTIKAIISKPMKSFGQNFGATILKKLTKLCQHLKFVSYKLTEK